jgi:hypothetical protein
MLPPDTIFLAQVKQATAVADLVKSVLTSLGIVGGAAWAYFKFFKGRTFRERLELAVSASIQATSNRRLLQVITSVKNVGLSKVPLLREGAGVRVLIFREDELPARAGDELAWTPMRTVDVLEGHDWIEPAEALQDQHLFVLPPDAAGIAKVEVVVVSEKHRWVARCINTTPEENDERQA